LVLVGFTRRRLFALGAATSASALIARALAQVRRRVRRRKHSADPMAIPDFIAARRGIPNGARHDASHHHNLRRSACFSRLIRPPISRRSPTFDTQPRFPDWRQINAQGSSPAASRGKARQSCAPNSAVGRVRRQPNSRRSSISPRPTTGAASRTSFRTNIYERLTGEKGYFDTRIVFIDETGSKERRDQSVLAIMDQDGANVRYLTRGEDLVLTARFSPSTQEITYMSYGQGDPRVFLLNIETGQREIVGNFPGMSFSPRFSRRPASRSS